MQKSLHVVVAGGTGNIGEGIIRSALRSGATVVVPSRGRAGLNTLERCIAYVGVKRILEIYRDRPAPTVHKLFGQSIPGFPL